MGWFCIQVETIGRALRCARVLCLLGALLCTWEASPARADSVPLPPPVPLPTSFEPLSLSELPPFPDEDPPFVDPVPDAPSVFDQPAPSPVDLPPPQPAPSLFDSAPPAPAAPAFGYVPRSTPRPWLFFAPYAWMSMMHGSITALGQTRAIDFDLNQVADRFTDANGAMQFHMEGGCGRWGAIVDTTILKLTPTLSVPGGHDNFDLRQTFVEFLGTYRLVDVSPGWATRQQLSVDFLMGGRYYEVKNGFTFVPFSPTRASIPLEQTQSWVDLVVGARARVPITPGLDAFARGDFGGFGMGTSSSAVWNVMAGLDCRLAPNWSFMGGYRVFDIDKSQGRGATAFALDAQIQGPFIALAVRF